VSTSDFSLLGTGAVGAHPQLMNVVTSELRRLIIEFELPPGTHLVEARLAEQLGVSRNPIREAIRVLSTEGFVHISPRRGGFVAHLSAQDAENLFDVRLGLEPIGAKLAARNGPTAGVAKLQETISKAHAAISSGELTRLPNLITQFHIGIMETANNPFLLTIAVPMIKRAQWVHLPDLTERAPHTWTEHTDMMRAIERGDEDLAEAQAREHVEAARLAYRERGPHAKHAAAIDALAQAELEPGQR
jgi:DNA-binding GntR family transcriptional regulator